MMLLSNEKGIDVLHELGLTLSEARVYLVLARVGCSKIGGISKATGIRREHMYQIVQSLETKGLVEKKVGPATKYIATPPNEAFSMLVKRERKKFSHMRAQIHQIIEQFNSPQQQTPTPEHRAAEFVLVSNKERNLIDRQRSLERAEKQIHLMHTWKWHLQFFQHYEETVNNALVKGIKIRQIIELPQSPSQMKTLQNLAQPVLSNPLLERRYVTQVLGNFAIVDDNELLLSTSKKQTNLAETPLLISTDEILVELAQKSFDAMWQTAFVDPIARLCEIN